MRKGYSLFPVKHAKSLEGGKRMWGTSFLLAFVAILAFLSLPAKSYAIGISVVQNEGGDLHPEAVFENVFRYSSSFDEFKKIRLSVPSLTYNASSRRIARFTTLGNASNLNGASLSLVIRDSAGQTVESYSSVLSGLSTRYVADFYAESFLTAGQYTIVASVSGKLGPWNVSYSANQSITVDPNTPPVANDVWATTVENEPVEITLDFSDAEDENPRYLVIDQRFIPHGSVRHGASSLWFTPELDWHGTTSFQYYAIDSGGLASDPATVTVVVTPANTAPVAVDQAVSTDEDVPLVFELNAVDPEGDVLSYTVVSNVSREHGSLTLEGGQATFVPLPNWNGVTTFTYRATDPSGLNSNTGTITVSVTPVNDAPVANNRALTIAEDTSGIATLVGSDVDGDALTYQVVTPPNLAHGSVSIDGDKATFAPKADWNGSTSFTYKAIDSGGLGSNTATVSITVTPVNDAPVASSIAATTAENQSASIPLRGTDVDGDSLTYNLVTAPNSAHGEVVISGSTAVFTPTPGWNGRASFVYRASDPAGVSSNNATVTVTVESVADAPVASNLTLTTAEDTVGVATLLATDADGDSLSYSVVSPPSGTHGTVKLEGNKVTFTPAPNWHGTTSFTYKATDVGGLNSNVATVTVTVTPVNDAPVSANRVLATQEDTAGKVTLVANDVDGHALHYAIVSEPNAAHGSVNINGAEATFTPAPNWNGTTSFTYKATDADGLGSNVATVTVTVSPVNDAPVASNRTLTVAEDTSGVVSLLATDVDGDALTYSIVAGPDISRGTVSLSGNQVTFTPKPNWHGSTTFTFKATDPAGASSNTATVTVVVTSVNDAPVASPVTLTTKEDTSGVATLLATDVDGDALTYSIVSGPNSGHGSVVLAGNKVTFTPRQDWNGTTSFTYKAVDSKGSSSNIRTVSVVVTPVNDAPVAMNRTLAVEEDTAGTVTLVATDVDGDELTYSIITHPSAAHGTIALSGDKVVFTPKHNWHGSTSFTYKATDTANASSNVATVRVNVTAANDAPVANAVTLTTAEDIPGSVTLLASDVDGDQISYVIVDRPNAAHGTVSLDGNKVTFTPKLNWNGETSFTYKAVDPDGVESNVAGGTITVTPVNDAPVASNGTLTSSEDRAGYAMLVASDVDGDALTFSVVNAPNSAHGTVSISGGRATFTPKANWNGSTTFTFKATDPGGLVSNTATISVTVTPVNDAPVSSNRSLTTLEDTAGTVTLVASDIDGDSLSYSVVAAPNAAHGTVSISANKATFTPKKDWNGSTSFTYKATDPGGLSSNTATVTVSVTPVNDAPVSSDRSLTTLEDTAGTVTLFASDVDGDSLSYSVVAAPNAAHGTVSISANKATFTPKKDWNGSTSFTYKATDPGGLSSNTATVTVSVTPVNDAPVANDTTDQLLVNAKDTFAMPVSDVDAGDVLTVSVVSSSLPAAAAIEAIGTGITVEPVPYWYGRLEIVYFVTDQAGAQSDEATFILDVVPPAPDVSGPAGRINTPLQCNNLEGVSQYLFSFTDYESGIDPDSLKVVADFQGERFDVPVSVLNSAQIAADLALGVGARLMKFVPVIEAGSGLEERLTRAFFGLEPEGGRKSFSFIVSLKDKDGNSTSQEFQINPLDVGDTKAPTIQIKTDFAGDVLTNVHGMTIAIDDDLTGIDAREVTAVLVYKGVEYPLSLYAPTEVGELSPDACVARHPLHLAFSSVESSLTEQETFAILAEAYVAKEPLRIQVTASDYAKNVASKSLTFTFEPEGFEANPVSIPGIRHQFRDKQNAPTVSIPVSDIAVEINSEVEYSAVIPENLAGVPLAVNGVPILPGDVIPLGAFKLANGGKFTFDIRADGNQVEGDAVIHLIPNGVAARAVTVPVHAWVPDIEISSDNWEPYQLFDRISLKATQTDSLACDITGAEQAALYSDRINKPFCFLRWSEKPPETYGLPVSRPELSGYVPVAGPQTVGYEVIVYSSSGTEFVIQQGSVPLHVKSAGDDMLFEVSPRDDTSYRFVSDFEATLTQEEGPSCSMLTTDDQIAESYSMTNRPACLIVWSDPLPEGIEASTLSTGPVVQGAFEQVEGNPVFNWKVYSFSGYGTRVELMSGTQELEILEPPPPEVVVDPRVTIRPNLFAVSRNGGFIGDLTVSSINAPVTIHTLENGELLDSDSTASGFGDTINYRSRLSIGEKPLWTLTPQAVKAFFTQKPEISTTYSFDVLAVPSSDLKPQVEVDDTTVLNTEELTVRASIFNPYDSDEVYNTETMGQWDIRLLNYISFNRREPMTEYKPVDEQGEAVFSIPLNDIGAEFLRILPEGRVLSPIAEYEHNAVGLRPLYVTVLRGEAIEANITARRLVGKAPLGLYATLNLANRLDYSAVGQIEWQVRDKDAGDWETVLEGEGEDRLYKSFPEGVYEVRAIVDNKNSGREFTTEVIEVHAFVQPEVELKGPSNIFVGATGKYTVEATYNGELLSESDVVVEWSEDGGETWVQGGLNYSLQRGEEERVYLHAKVRMMTSPADFEDASVIKKMRVGFRPIRPPRAGVYGPRVIETGFPVEWRGLARAPYPEMDVIVKGRFILPDGTKVESDTVTYTASDSDASEGRVPLTYEVWMEGFEEGGGSVTTTRQINVWTYEWPAWEFYVRASTLQAPSDISMRLRNPAGSSRYLEGLTYEWEIPAGLTVESGNKDDSRVFRAETAGRYPVNVTISDGRGYESRMQYVIDVSPADPWLVDYRISTSGEEYRSPMSLRTIPEIRGGHPRDRITGHRYYLDGELVADGTRYFSTELLEGTHELALEISSDFGEVVRESKTIEVLPNTPPTCRLDARQTLSGWRFSADCEDVDGSIAAHEWTVNGEVIGISSGRISVTVRDESVPRVTLKAFDNGGAVSNTVIW